MKMNAGRFEPTALDIGPTPALMANVGEVSIQQEVGQGLSLWFWAALAAVAILVFVKRP
jgi:hypothetical protein